MLRHKSAFISKLINHPRLMLGLLFTLFFLGGSGPWLTSVAAYQVQPVVDDQTFVAIENSATGTPIGTVVATNADTYAIIAGNGLGAFAIDTNTGLLTVADGTQIDYEINPVFSLTVEVTNPNGSDTGIMTINVLNVNDAPVVDDQTFDIVENSPNGTSLGSIVAIDPDGNTLYYTILFGNTGNTFGLGLTSGELTVADNTLLDYETNPQFTLLVMVSDGGLNDTAVITINVLDANDPPVAFDDAYTTTENITLNVPLPGVLGNDTDLENDPLTAVLDSGPSNGLLNLNANGGFVYTPNLNFDGVDSFTYFANDGFSNSAVAATVTITVTNLNDPPTVNDDTFSVDENSANGTAVGTVTATDPDNDPLTFSIIAGNTNNAFAIGSSSGQITVNNSAALDFENIPTFTLTVRAQDPGGLSDTGTIIINLNDINEAPIFFDDSLTIPENSPNGTSLGIVSAIDPDAGDTLTYSIMAGNTGNTFALDSGTGEITVNDNTLLDFETNPVFVLTVRATDTGGLFDEAFITIDVTNVNEFPPDINPQTFSVSENAANGATVGTINVSDGDGQDTFTFAILGGDPAGVFSINNAGMIAVADNSTLDFETTPSYSLDVQVTDSGALTDTAVMTINVLDANDPPVINNLSVTPAAIQETEMITLTGSFADQDSGDAHTVTILWADGSNNVLNLAAGTTVFTATHTYQDDPVGLPDDYLIQVTVADAAASDSDNATATVTNIAPLLAGTIATPPVLDEGQTVTLTSTILEASPLDSFSLSIDWGDGVVESFSYAAGTTSFQETHTYQDNYNPATIVATLADDDDGSYVAETAVTVNNLPPTADAGPDLIVLDGDPANFSGAASDPGALDTLTFDWDFGDTTSASGTLTPAHVYPGVGVYTATLTVTDDDGADAADTAVVTVVSPSDIVAHKTVNGVFDEGGTVIYTIAITNTSTSAQLDNPGNEFEDVLPAELSLTNAQVVSGGGTVAMNGNTVTWSGAIPGNSTVVLEIEAIILPGFRGQMVSNQGQIFYDGDGDGQNEATTYTDDPAQPGTFDATTFTIQAITYVYLPIIMNGSVNAPDLVITAVSASSDLIEVTIENQGNAATASGFWVDFYINPSAPPTGPNQLWYDLSDEGLAWGVTELLSPGESLTLVYSTDPNAPNLYFAPEESLYNGSLPTGTLVYVQVDSARENVSYGGILETHEILGQPYNNITSGIAD